MENIHADDIVERVVGKRQIEAIGLEIQPRRVDNIAAEDLRPVFLQVAAAAAHFTRFARQRRIADRAIPTAVNSTQDGLTVPDLTVATNLLFPFAMAFSQVRRFRFLLIGRRHHG